MDSTAPTKAVVLLSGGLDSTVLLYGAIEQHGRNNVRALSIDYGQRHYRETFAAGKIATINMVPFECATLMGLKSLINKGSQTGGVDVPDGHYTDESMKVTIVPNRNAIMLSIAVGHAIARGCNLVLFAAHSGDHAIYPDCRAEFIDAFDRAMHEGNLWNPVNVDAPYIDATKAEIVGIGSRLNVPFALTWSCYKGGDIHCGTCGTCTERKEAFKLANVEDPTLYAA